MRTTLVGHISAFSDLRNRVKHSTAAFIPCHAHVTTSGLGSVRAKVAAVFHTDRVALFLLHRKLQPGDFGVKQFNPDLRVLDAEFRESVKSALLPRPPRSLFSSMEYSCRVRPVKVVQMIGQRWLRPRDTCCTYSVLNIIPALSNFRRFVRTSYALFGCASELRAKHEDTDCHRASDAAIYHVGRPWGTKSSIPRILAVVLRCIVGDSNIVSSQRRSITRTLNRECLKVNIIL